MISEMQTHTQALFNPNTEVKPYELKQWCTEAIAGGATGIIYWMWRPFDRGTQILGRGLVDYKGEGTERLNATKEIGELLKKTEGAKPVRSKVGILFFSENENFQRAITTSYPVDDNYYINSIYGAYRALFNENVRCDIIVADEFENYSAVIITNCIMIDGMMTEKLKEFVLNGGTLIIDGRFGIMNEVGRAYDCLPGGSFNEFCGVTLKDTDSLLVPFSEYGVCGYKWRQITESNSQVVEYFQDGVPAVTLKKSGKGRVIMLNTDFFYGCSQSLDDNKKKFIKSAVDKLDLRQIETDTELKVRISETDKEYFVFIFNYTESTHSGEIDVFNNKISVSVTPHEIKIERIAK